MPEVAGILPWRTSIWQMRNIWKTSVIFLIDFTDMVKHRQYLMAKKSRQYDNSCRVLLELFRPKITCGVVCWNNWYHVEHVWRCGQKLNQCGIKVSQDFCPEVAGTLRWATSNSQIRTCLLTRTMLLRPLSQKNTTNKSWASFHGNL